MSLSAEEQQRLDAILDFLLLHRMRIILVSTILLLVAGVWLVHGAVSKSRIQESSAHLISLNEALEAENKEAVDEAFRKILDVGVPDYIEQAGLVVAASRFWQDDKDGAAEAYRAILDASGDPGMQGLVKLRLAQVLIDIGKPEEALDIIRDHSYGADSTLRMLFEEVVGDALVAMGDFEEATIRYTLVLQLLKPSHGSEYESMVVSKLALISQEGVDLSKVESDG
jgi:predicted negative regulator of RcsB-dependent stress response